MNEEESKAFMLIYNIREKIEKMNVIENGHMGKPSFNLFSFYKDKHFSNALIQLENNNQKNSLLVGTFDCTCCGNEIDMFYNGSEVYLENTCEVLFEPFSFNIPVPSGVLVVHDCLRKHFKDFDRYVNHFYGIFSCVEDYAKQNMFHTYVGNTCPSIIQKTKSKIEFGNFENKNKVGSVCTDLWWVSAVDIDILRDMYLKNNDMESFNNLINNEATLVHVKPGTYKCTSYYSIYGTKKSLYADMVWISKEINLNSLPLEKPQTYIEQYLNSKYSSLYPSFSTYIYHILNQSAYGVNSWFKYNYNSDKEQKMALYSFKNFLTSTLEPQIPEFTYFLPKYKLFLNNKNNCIDSDRELDINQMWTGYEYGASIEFLSYLLVFTKTLYSNKDTLLCKEGSIKTLTTIMNMAYTNIIERNLESDIIEFLSKIDFNSECMTTLHPSIIKSYNKLADTSKWYFNSNDILNEFEDWKEKIKISEYQSNIL